MTWPPKPKCRPKCRPTQIQWDKVKIERLTATSRKKKIPRPPNAAEIARAARIQEMIEAQEQGLRRLHLGRQRAMINRRAIRSIMEKDARIHAERNEHRKQLIAELSTNFKEQELRSRAWVKQIEESYKNSEPLAVRMEREYQMRQRNPVQVEGSFGGPELNPAKEEEDTGNQSKEAKETEESRKPLFPRVLGDSKMIKMKVMNKYVVSSIFKVPSTLQIFPFVNKRCHFQFFNSQQIFLYKIKEKGKYESNHLASNLEPQFPNIPLIPLHYQVHPVNFR